MKRDKLADAMARRSPLGQRESVDPVDLYTLTVDEASEVDVVDNPNSQQVAMSTSGQLDLVARQHVHKETSHPGGEAEALRRRYTTYLKPETIKAIKWLALDRERNDYDVVQEALDEYLRSARR